ncbi:WbuC family cupin fold metalloprotein [Candidatus Daviesbacteria bacterium]|nr:WbuC family cupin fold metalloprotein [Candidatus Daviesbacteria bacterium]
MIIPVDQKLISQVINTAKRSARRRSNYNFHQPSEAVQRLINVFCQGTYAPPHQHSNPDKVELFIALDGRGVVVEFDDRGKVTRHCVIDSRGPVKACEIQPGTWHTVIGLSAVDVFYEIIEGPYNPSTHKKFAPWAPKEEDQEQAQEYIAKILKEFKKNL